MCERPLRVREPSCCLPAALIDNRGLPRPSSSLPQIPELGDTVFVVLRKKPLIFLHWYHHVTVLLYCWHSYASRSSAGLYFVVRAECGWGYASAVARQPP
jgi:hypothetical protein